MSETYRPIIDWDDPAARGALVERIGAEAHHAALLEHQKRTAVTIVNGHAIRPVRTRFGRLFSVGSTGKAFATLAEATRFAGNEPAGERLTAAAGRRASAVRPKRSREEENP
jgi:hypothetical protein